MILKQKLTNIAYAQSDTIAHPTIPFIPPGINPGISPTPSPINSNVGPIIYLQADKTVYSKGDSGVIDIKIHTQGEEVDEFTIVIEFDPTHIQIRDEDAIEPGIQIEYLDTHFETTVNGNIVETNITNSESGLTGRITIHARAKNDQSITITDRTIAKIHFLVSTNKTSKLIISKSQSNLLLDNINKLDTDWLEDLTISSFGNIVPTPTSNTLQPTPDISVNPDTALSDNMTEFISITFGIFLVLLGIYTRHKINKTRKK